MLFRIDISPRGDESRGSIIDVFWSDSIALLPRLLPLPWWSEDAYNRKTVDECRATVCMLLRDLLLLVSKIILSTCLFFTPHLVAVQASARTRALMIFRLPSSSRPEATLDHPAWPLLHKSCIFDIEFNWAEGWTLSSSVAKIKVLAYGAQVEHLYVY